MKLKHGEGSVHSKSLKRESLQHDLSDRLLDAKRDLCNALTLEAAGMAGSLVPELRTIGRKIFGIEKTILEPDQEELVERTKLAIAGDNRTLYSLSREIMEDDDVDEEMTVMATGFVCLYSIYTIKLHASDPSKGPEEERVVELIESIIPSVVSMIRDDLEIISTTSPFEKVKVAARNLLDQIS